MDFAAARKLAQDESDSFVGNPAIKCPKLKTGLLVLVYRDDASKEVIQNAKVTVKGEKSTDVNGLARWLPLSPCLLFDYKVRLGKLPETAFPTGSYEPPPHGRIWLTKGQCPVHTIGIAPPGSLKIKLVEKGNPTRTFPGAEIEVVSGPNHRGVKKPTGADGVADFGLSRADTYRVRVTLKESDRTDYVLVVKDSLLGLTQGDKDPKVLEVRRSLKLKVDFDAPASDLREVWDLWIAGSLKTCRADFQVTADPADYEPIEYLGTVESSDGSTVRNNLATTATKSSPILCGADWDGKNDLGEKVPPGIYRIRLTARGDATQATAVSRDLKIVRVGVKAVAGENPIALKFAFRQYPTLDTTCNFDIPREQWQLEALDLGSQPTPAPACSRTGVAASDKTYCYPLAAKLGERLGFRTTIAGAGFDPGSKVRLRLVMPGTTTTWSNDEAKKIATGFKPLFTATPANALPSSVGIVDRLGFDFLFDYETSKGGMEVLGRQPCSEFAVYTLAATPRAPWVAEKPWIEVLEKACGQWALGATNEEEARDKIVEAVNKDLGLAYDTVQGADCNSLVTKSGGVPQKIRLRAFLGWLANLPGRPANWNVLNCTCCGALTSTFANILGCDLNSSVLAKDAWAISGDPNDGFDCHKIIAIGFTVWHHPFHNVADTAGGFAYHEVAWDGGSGAGDKVYDACLQAASNPVTAAATNPLYIQGITYSTGAPGINDYVRRLVLAAQVAAVKPQTARSGRYRPS